MSVNASKAVGHRLRDRMFLIPHDPPSSCRCLAHLTAAALCLIMVGSSFAQPILRSMQPFALKRGGTIIVRFQGEKLGGTYRALSYSDGWQDADWNVREDGKQATAQVTIAEDCHRGWHCLRLCTPTGISELVTYYVSDEEPMVESPQPHPHAAPQEISPVSLIAGTLQPRDVDAYAIQVEAGQRISVEVQGLRTGRAMFDPQLELIGPDEATLAFCDDTPLTRQDPYFSVIAPETGRYVLLVSEAQHSGNGGFWYLLHVGSFPRPSIAQPLGGLPQSQVQLTWLSADGPLFEQTVSLPASPTDEFPVFPADGQGVAPTPVYLRVNDLPVVTELEPNEPRSPQVVPVPVAIHGILQQDKDDDLFRVHVQKGQVLDIRAFARHPHRSPIDAILAIRRSDQSYLTSNDDANGSPDSYLRYTFPEDGDYFILIRDQRQRGQPDMAYRLEIAPPAAKLSLASPEWQRNVSATVTIPSGNRMALLVNATRQDIGGEVSIRAHDLPQHVSMAAVRLPADRYQLPVLFEAATDAAPQGGLTALIGEMVEGPRHVTGQLTIRHRLVSGRNNVEMLATTLDRLATVVADPVPVLLQIVQPQVPLVRSGAMNLRIQANRSGDFDGPIALRMLYNPNGVSSQGQVTIPAGQTEATLAMTANAAAQLGSWPIAVLGQADLNGRNCEMSTQIAQLEIAEAFFALNFPTGNLEQTASLRYPVDITVKQAFEGDGSAELLGLPPGVTAAPAVFSAASTTIQFDLQAAENARLGRFEGISCRLTIRAHDEPIVHILGGGSLRVDPRTTSTTTNQTSQQCGRDRRLARSPAKRATPLPRSTIRRF